MNGGFVISTPVDRKTFLVSSNTIASCSTILEATPAAANVSVLFLSSSVLRPFTISAADIVRVVSISLLLGSTSYFVLSSTNRVFSSTDLSSSFGFEALLPVVSSVGVSFLFESAGFETSLSSFGFGLAIGSSIL